MDLPTETTGETVMQNATSTATTTPPPLAATVNGEGILLDTINNEILRYLAAYPESSIRNAFDIVVQDQVDLLLLSQAARTAGYEVTGELVDSRIDSLIAEIGSNEHFTQWLEDNHYTIESFRQALALSLEAEYQRSLLSATIPGEMEQVELCQILVYDETTANQIQAALSSGTDFDWLRAQYHPDTKGYLGWHVTGTLLQPALEVVAFGLEAGTFSPAIQTEYGYHFIKVLQKTIHPVSMLQRQAMEQKLLTEWIIEQRNLADIVIIAVVED